MPITWRCECGKRLRASRADAGRRGKCPSCGRGLRIPGEAAGPPAGMGMEDLAARIELAGSSAREKALWWGIAAGALALAAIPFVYALVSGCLAPTRSPPSSQRDSGEPRAEQPTDAQSAPRLAATQRGAGTGAAEAEKTQPGTVPPAGEKQAPAVEFTRRGGPPVPPAEPPAETTVWPRIVLDETLFPGGSVWRAVEVLHRGGVRLGVFGPGPPEEFIAMDGGVTEGRLTPVRLQERYGPGEVVRENGLEWHRYGPLALGIAEGEEYFSRLMAPRRFFEQGFVPCAKEAVQAEK